MYPLYLDALMGEKGGIIFDILLLQHLSVRLETCDNPQESYRKKNLLHCFREMTLYFR